MLKKYYFADKIYERFQIAHAKLLHAEEVIMYNVSATVTTKQNSGDSIYTKVNILLPC